MGKTRAVKYNTVSRTKRRMDQNLTVGKKNVLVVPEDMLDRDNFVYMIVNEDAGNVEYHESLDYDVVRNMPEVVVGDDNADKAKQDGSVVRLNVGGGKTAVLMSKPKKWYDEDKAAQEKRLQEMDKQMEAENNQKYEKFK